MPEESQSIFPMVSRWLISQIGTLFLSANFANAFSIAGIISWSAIFWHRVCSAAVAIWTLPLTRWPVLDISILLVGVITFTSAFYLLSKYRAFAKHHKYSETPLPIVSSLNNETEYIFEISHGLAWRYIRNINFVEPFPYCPIHHFKLREKMPLGGLSMADLFTPIYYYCHQCDKKWSITKLEISAAQEEVRNVVLAKIGGYYKES
jgi:hypothetical protein